VKAVQLKITNIKFIYLFSFIMLIGSGCLHLRTPLLLRNRPNVPAPSLDPKVDDYPAEIQNNNIITKTPTVLDISNELDTPPLVIENDVTPIAIPEIKSVSLTHTVKKGESFWKISRKYGINKSELASCNNLALNKPLKVGTTLIIPPGGVENHTPKPLPKRTTPTKKTKTIKKPVEKNVSTNKDGTYTIQQGDSLWKIARKFNTTIKKLAETNNMDRNSVLKLNSTLIIPGVSTTQVQSTTKKETKAITPIVNEPIKNPQENGLEKLLEDAENANDSTEIIDDVSDILPNEKKTPKANPIDIEIEKVVDYDTSGDLYTEEILPNETLPEIAERHGLTVEELLKVNPELKANQKLKPFSSIKIPNKQ